MVHLLIADDEMLERAVLYKTLHKNLGERCVIFQAENGREALQIYEKHNIQVVILDIEMPGFKKEDIRAELKDGYLTVEAQTTSDRDEKDDKGRYIRRERYSGSCQRRFFVGREVTQEDIRAKFDNGILKLTVPKKEALPKKEEDRYIAIEG